MSVKKIENELTHFKLKNKSRKMFISSPYPACQVCQLFWHNFIPFKFVSHLYHSPKPLYRLQKDNLYKSEFALKLKC